MKLQTKQFLRCLGVAALGLFTAAAQAHTGHGTSGLSEGLAHPMGMDHLLAMLAVGLWSVSALPAGKAWRGPATFMSSLILSAGLGAAGVSLPQQEQWVALSVVLFGLMLLLSRQKVPPGIGLGLVALAASLHGLAHGAETPETGFAAYAVGFLATTAVLHFGGVATGLSLRKLLAEKTTLAMAALGTLCSGAGLYLFGQL